MTRFSFTGSPPFRILIEYLVQQKDFLSDAGTILRLPEETYEELARALSAFNGFLDRKALSEITSQTVPSGNQPETVSGVIWRLNRYVRESDETLTESLQILKTAIQKHGTDFESEQRSQLGDRLATLIAEPLGFVRQHKADRLVEATGRELTDLQIICDLRPVFNEERTEIEGAIPVSTLTLDLVELDGNTTRLEVRLSKRQIADLCRKAESAKGKSALIEKMLADKGIVLPRTSATVDDGDGK